EIRRRRRQGDGQRVLVGRPATRRPFIASSTGNERRAENDCEDRTISHASPRDSSFVFMARGPRTTANGPRTAFKYDAALMRSRVFLLAAALLLAHRSAGAQQKVIVLGFDGVGAGYTERWMNEGKLPNLARLRQSGTFRPLRPTIPAQTPVSWSTFSTGIDPGRTGIFDFLRRDPKTYLPLFAAFDDT